MGVGGQLSEVNFKILKSSPELKFPFSEGAGREGGRDMEYMEFGAATQHAFGVNYQILTQNFATAC